MDLYLTLQTAFRFAMLFAPFFALSMFLCLTRNYTEEKRKRESIKIVAASFLLCVTLIFFGDPLFLALGITIDAFRVGVGTLLLLDGIALVKGKITPPASDSSNEEIAIVPMAIPVLVGPAVIGTMIVVGTEAHGIEEKIANVVAMGISCLAIWIMLYLATTLERHIGTKILNILSKITGIYLTALASQMILQGCKAALF